MEARSRRRDIPMDLTFSEPAERLRPAARSWIAENLPDEWRGIGRDADDDTLAAVRRGWGETLARGGWAAPAWPTAYGGAGLSLQEHAVLLEELVAARAPDALNASTIAILGHMIIRHGDERQKSRYLPPMLDHSNVWCQGFSEPEAGSDLAALRTKGTIKGDVIRINGQKLWTTMAQFADHCYALVRTDPSSTRHEGISLVLIETDQPGVVVRPIKTIAGADEFAEVFFDDAVASVEDVVGPLHQGWKVAIDALSFERGISFVQRALRLRQEVGNARDLAQERGLDNDAVVRARLVDAEIEARLLHGLVLRILAMAETGDSLGPLPEIAKLHWSENHQRVLSLTADLLGPGLGELAHAGLLAGLMHSRADTIYAGSSEVLRNGIARSIGLPSSRPSR
jgi:alkylation response protein AidB-like acyl-CoA dehydrogenase